MGRIEEVAKEIQAYIDMTLQEEKITFQQLLNHFKVCPVCRARIIQCPFCEQRTPIDIKCHSCGKTLPLDTILTQLARDLSEEI